MRNPQGYAMVTSPEEARVRLGRFYCDVMGVLERDTFTCYHCNRVVHVQPLKSNMEEFGSMCRNCMKMVCAACAPGPCIPFEKKLDEAEKRQYIRRQYAKL